MTRGIILANTGSPDAPEPQAVRAYLSTFLADPRICPMNPRLWHLILHAFILPKRCVSSAEKYRLIWTDEGSPLSVHMASLAAGLEAAAGEGVRVRHAMSYGAPSMAHALAELRDEGCADITVVPLYPQSAHSTTGVVSDQLAAALEELAWQPQVRVIERYADEPAYLDAIAESVRAAGFEEAGDGLLFAFHSIPLADVRAGDAYGEQAAATAQAVAERLGLTPGQWQLGFQSRFDKHRRWLSPFTREVLPKLDACERLFVVAPNFSVDCLETLYDIDIVLRQECQQQRPTRPFIYVPSLNATPAHISLLRTLITP